MKPASLRYRRWRRRQSENAIVLPPIELRAAEVSHLVSTGLLDPDSQADKLAVLHALYKKMDQVFAQADNKDIVK